MEMNYRVRASVHRQIAAVFEDFAAEFAGVVATRLFLVVHRTDAADATDATAAATAAAYRRVAQAQRWTGASCRTQRTTDAVQTDAVAAIFIWRT